MKFGKTVALGAVVLAMAIPALAQTRGGGFSPSFRLLGIPEVRAELKLTPEQAEQVTKLQSGMKNRLVDTLRGLKSAPAQERRKKFDQFRQGVDRQIVEILDAGQRKRLRELELQQAGPRALLQPNFAAELRLSASQTSKIRQIAAKEKTKLHELYAAVPPQKISVEERTKLMKQVEELNKETDGELLKVLSADQRTRFKVLQGLPFKFPVRATRPAPANGNVVKPAPKPAAPSKK